MYRKEEKEKVVVERYPYKTTNSLNEGLLASVVFLYNKKVIPELLSQTTVRIM